MQLWGMATNRTRGEDKGNRGRQEQGDNEDRKTGKERQKGQGER